MIKAGEPINLDDGSILKALEPIAEPEVTPAAEPLALVPQEGEAAADANAPEHDSHFQGIADKLNSALKIPDLAPQESPDHTPTGPLDAAASIAHATGAVAESARKADEVAKSEEENATGKLANSTGKNSASESIPETKPLELAADTTTTKVGTEPKEGEQNALPIEGPGSVLQREPGEAGKTGSERGRVESIIEGTEVAKPSEATAEARNLPAEEVKSQDQRLIPVSKRTAKEPVNAPSPEAEKGISQEAGQPEKSAEAADGKTQPLKNTASWVIKEKATGKVIMETFDQKKVDALNTSKYEAVPIEKHLQSLNEKPGTPAPLGKEVSRYTSRQTNADGSYKAGSGMDAFNAKQFAHVLDKAHPELQHVPVERDNGRFDVVGHEKTAQESAAPMTEAEKLVPVAKRKAGSSKKAKG